MILSPQMMHHRLADALELSDEVEHLRAMAGNAGVVAQALRSEIGVGSA